MIPRNGGEQNALWWATHSEVYRLLKVSRKPWTVAELIAATGGKESTIRAALGLMVQRGLVQRIEGSPLQFLHHLAVVYEYHDKPELELMTFEDWKQDLARRRHLAER